MASQLQHVPPWENWEHEFHSRLIISISALELTQSHSVSVEIKQSELKQPIYWQIGLRSSLHKAIHSGFLYPFIFRCSEIEINLLLHQHSYFVMAQARRKSFRILVELTFPFFGQEVTLQRANGSRGVCVSLYPMHYAGETHFALLSWLLTNQFISLFPLYLYPQGIVPLHSKRTLSSWIFFLPWDK